MNDRIKAIADAATYLFLRQGYAKTQISHIAKIVGVSVGTIYLDFVGKREIMHFILKCTIDPEFVNRKFDRPITDDLFIGLENDIVATFQTSGDNFAKHISESAVNYTLETIISDAFDILSKFAVGCLFIEKNQFDFKFLSEHYKLYRKRFFETMMRYMANFIECGKVRPVKHLELSTTMIIEILSWWAMDVRYTSFEIYDIPINLAKEICLDNILSAYQIKN